MTVDVTQRSEAGSRALCHSDATSSLNLKAPPPDGLFTFLSQVVSTIDKTLTLALQAYVPLPPQHTAHTPTVSVSLPALESTAKPLPANTIRLLHPTPVPFDHPRFAPVKRERPTFAAVVSAKPAAVPRVSGGADLSAEPEAAAPHVSGGADASAKAAAAPRTGGGADASAKAAAAPRTGGGADASAKAAAAPRTGGGADAPAKAAAAPRTRGGADASAKAAAAPRVSSSADASAKAAAAPRVSGGVDASAKAAAAPRTGGGADASAKAAAAPRTGGGADASAKAAAAPRTGGADASANEQSQDHGRPAVTIGGRFAPLMPMAISNTETHTTHNTHNTHNTPIHDHRAAAAAGDGKRIFINPTFRPSTPPALRMSGPPATNTRPATKPTTTRSQRREELQCMTLQCDPSGYSPQSPPPANNHVIRELRWVLGDRIMTTLANREYEKGHRECLEIFEPLVAIIAAYNGAIPPDTLYNEIIDQITSDLPHPTTQHAVELATDFFRQLNPSTTSSDLAFADALSDYDDFDD